MTLNILLAPLRQAMMSERDGATFYSMAAQNAEDPGAAALFSRLADEERGHFLALQREYRSILDTGHWDPNTAWAAPWKPDYAGKLFSDDFRRRIQGRHVEMAALSIGMLLEMQSLEFYVEQAQQAQDESVKAFFRELAAWENGHYQMLLREDEWLKEAYWEENRFAPLL